MPRLALALALAPTVALLACSDDEKRERRAAANAPPTPVAADAAVVPSTLLQDAGVATGPAPTFTPGDYHLDDDAPTARPGARVALRDRKPAQLLLRSTPIGAIAAVDGVRLGPTPVLWEGILDGQSHDFTFVMAGHALARYKFVPVTSGIVHATLVKMTDDADAGVPEIPAPPPR